MLNTSKPSQTISMEKIIDLIRTVRNDLVKDLLQDDVLTSYYEGKLQKSLSDIKREFMKRDLKELLISPVDLVHYAGLINHIKEAGTASIEEKNAVYFYGDIDQIVNKYAV